MPLRLLSDENIPGAVIVALKVWGMDVLCAHPGSADEDIAELAKREGRVIVTFDSDFANVLAFPPSEFGGIVRVKLNPPFVSLVIASLKRVFEAFPTHELIRGKLVIAEASLFRVWEEPSP